MAPPSKTPIKRSVRTRSKTASVSDTASIQSIQSESDEEPIAKIIKTEGESSGVRTLAENQEYLEAFDNIRFTKKELANAILVLRYPLCYGQVFPASLFEEVSGLHEVEKALAFQGWKTILDDAHDIYPVQIAQFWATVVVDGMVLHADFGGKRVEITMEEFGEIFGVPCGGVEIEAWGGWKDTTAATKTKMKKFVDSTATENSLVAVAQLSPLARVWFNVLHTALLPRKKGVNKLHSHEVMAMFSILNKRKVNLPYLVFSEIANKAQRLLLPEFTSQFVVPYSMWLSKILEIKGVIPKDALTLPSYKPMTIAILQNKIKVLTNDGRLVTGDKGKGKSVSETEPVQDSGAGNMNESVLNAFFERIEKMVDAKFEKLEELVMRYNPVEVLDALNLGMLGKLTKLSDQLVEVQAELSKCKEEVAFSMCGAIHKISQMKKDVDVLLADNEVMKDHGKQLVAGLEEAVIMVRRASKSPTDRHTELLAKIREIHDDTARCRYIINRQFPQV